MSDRDAKPKADGAESASTAGLGNNTPRIYPRARRSKAEVQDGHTWVHGRMHGFAYRPVWDVEVEFDSEAEATAFFESLREHGINGRPVWTAGS